MGFSIRNFLRKWVRKLLPRNSIEKELKVQIAVSSTMDHAIELWKDMYENNPPWRGETGVICTNLPATIAEEMARLVLTEFEAEITGGRLGEFFSEQLKREMIDLDTKMELFCAKGGIVLKPYVSADAKGRPDKIEIDFVEADKFYPTAYNSKGEVSSAVFVQHKREGDYLYTRLEYHEFSGTELIVTNKAFRSQKIVTYNEDDSPVVNSLFDEEVPLSSVEEWAGLSEEPITIGNVTEPLFAYIRTPKSNNIDTGSPLGVSVYSKAIELLHEADRMFGKIVWEYDAKEAAIHVSEEFLDTDKKGKPILPEGHERLYRAFDESKDKSLFDIYSPEIRSEPLFDGLNKMLKRIEWNVGLAYGTISDPDMMEKTATEILSAKQRSYRIISRMQNAWEHGFEHLVRSMRVLNALYKIVPDSEVEISCTWGDGVMEDTEKEYQRRWSMVVAGKMKLEKFYAWYFGCSEEEAKEYIPAAQPYPPEE